MTSIDLNPEIAYAIIDRVHNFYAGGDDADHNEAVDPAAYADGYRPQQASDSTFLEVETGIHDLEPDQQVTLVALMWLGRGDFGPTQWPEACALAQERWNGRTADYLTATPLLADYLEEALNQLGYIRE